MNSNLLLLLFTVLHWLLYFFSKIKSGLTRIHSYPDGMALPEYDPSQWSITTHGRQCTVESILWGMEWKVNIHSVDKLVKKLDLNQITDVLKFACPRRAKGSVVCGNQLTLAQIVQARATTIVHSSTKVEMMALLLRDANVEKTLKYQRTKVKPRIKYLIAGRQVCAQFYMKVHDITKNTCANIASEELGDHSWKIPSIHQVQKVLPKFDRKPTDYRTAVAFWADFFKSCCPSPTEGVFLFPVYLSIKAIYAMFFVDWFISVRRSR